MILIYGPPAAGKLTVANTLSARTGAKVFHNHLTIDCTKPVFEFGTPAFWDINHRLRCEIIAAATRSGVELIHTFVYEKGPDDEYFRHLIAAAEENSGKVDLVMLVCRDDVRRERITAESRVKLRKLTDPESVGAPGRPDLFSPFPDRESLVIDTSDIEPDETARLIIEAFGLKELDRNRTYADESEIVKLVASFENATIDRDAWKHAEHLVVALYYLVDRDIETATKLMRNGIFKLLKIAFEVDLTKEMPYHETLTIFWMRTVESFIRERAGRPLTELAPELVNKFDKDYPLRFYSRDLLFSDEARRKFVEPDLVMQ